MQDFETEEQQIAAIKQWWKSNGTSLIFGLAIGVAAIGGWKYYVDMKNTHLLQASDNYVALLQTAGNGDDVLDKAKVLIRDYEDTPYAALTALRLAKLEFTNNNIDEALTQLEWVVDHAIESELIYIARYRMAKIYISQEKYAEAKELLLTTYPPAFEARYEELKGDLYVAEGDEQQAITAYDKAIARQKGANQWLQMKRESLGVSLPDKLDFSESSV